MESTAEQEIKEKIKNNASRVGEYSYLLEYAGLDLDHLCTSENCLVNYFMNHEDVIEDIEFTSIGISEKDSITGKMSVLFENKYRNLIYNLKIIPEKNIEAQTIVSRMKDVLNMSFFEYSKVYLDFFNCVFLNEKHCIRKFDMLTFHSMFDYDYVDENILNFIIKLIDDPLTYSDAHRHDIIVILVYVLGYSKRNKLKYTHFIEEKLRNCVILTRNTSSYNVKLVHDLYIDKYILKLRKICLESLAQIYEESLFMNYIYSNFITKHSLDREVFQDFQNRLYKITNTIKEEYLLSFLKHVFFKHSVLFGCIDDLQLVKSILDFYEKLLSRNKTESNCKNVYDLFISISLRISKIELFNLIIKHTNRMFVGEKYLLAKLLAIERLSNIQQYLETHKESFNLIKQIMDVYYCLLSVIQSSSFIAEKSKMSILSEFFEVHVFVFRNLRSNFFIKFFNKHIKGFTCILEQVFLRMIDPEEEEEDDFLQFNRKYWDVLSKVVLHIYQFMVAVSDETKKDKKKEKKSPFIKTVDLLLVVIYKIEDQLAIKYGADKVTKFKSRSFKITDMNEDF